MLQSISYTLNCNRCKEPFVSLSIQKQYCPVCAAIQAAEVKARLRATFKATKENRPKPVVEKKRKLMTDKEQMEINKRVALINHVPPDPGRTIVGEEFERIKAELEARERRK